MGTQYDILIIDDEPVVIASVTKILGQAGYSVDTATDAETALKKLDQNYYRVLISDLMLPLVSGFSLIEASQDKLATTPVIMISGYATLENAISSFRLGVFDFVPKPFDVDELVAVVFRALSFSDRLSGATETGPTVPPPAGSRRYKLGNHSMASFDGTQARITVGVTFPNCMGELESIEITPLDTGILQGRTCARIFSKGNMVHRVWAPLSGRIARVNKHLLDNITLIDTDPYEQGWLIDVAPTNPDNELDSLTLEVAASVN